MMKMLDIHFCVVCVYHYYVLRTKFMNCITTGIYCEMALIICKEKLYK